MPVVSNTTASVMAARAERAGEAPESLLQARYPDRRILAERAMRLGVPVADIYDHDLSLMIGLRGGQSSLTSDDIRRYFAERFGPRPAA
jgi:hypothetical protein